MAQRARIRAALAVRRRPPEVVAVDWMPTAKGRSLFGRTESNYPGRIGLPKGIVERLNGLSVAVESRHLASADSTTTDQGVG